MATSISTIKTPRRFLFIASIGNIRPYRSTRHSAGHILLDALRPLLPARIPFVSSNPQAATGPIFHHTWYSPSYMNESGPKLVRQLSRWMAATQTDLLERVVRPGHIALVHPEDQPQPEHERGRGKGPEWQRRGVDPGSLTRFSPTLVILHDELEAPLGKVKVRRGGPETASLRGHRGLISVMESLRGKGLYPPRGATNADAPGELAVLRVGVGIGRPSTRNRGDVANFVLTEMDAAELSAVKAAAGPVLDILADELYRGD
ncbi:putative peptidyl-tRNA hydrolase [Aspergillus steynii IBT 23096]|uniref:Putative peptidyl-tRNA hydrolase n=1 Tax=Aspergillus steynii IBT 23096 TaxID=1392250 RepID=A0A2I2GG07_9EURO|nr:putative peptidyl-tRNA hydrolase [Aspergillus steynii IBT 23096]PLB51816.1 putative peptidyl-tRNA hydrolase [Aspergillus steynii IBT 23096]